MASQKLTEYEHKRLENIRHNNEIMAALKLQSKASQLSNERVITKSEKKPKTETPFLIRHSFRTRGIPPDFKGLDFHPKTPTSTKFRLSHRLASLVTFCQNRKKPNFDKNVRCNVRREVALRMQRNKGRFTSAKSNHDESASAEMNCGTSEGLMADNDGSQQQDNVCRHCNISEKCTPMMRRGPEGPRTLCNACGLLWANKICRKNGR